MYGFGNPSCVVVFAVASWAQEWRSAAAKQFKNGFKSFIKHLNSMLSSILTFKNGNSLWAFVENEPSKNQKLFLLQKKNYHLNNQDKVKIGEKGTNHDMPLPVPHFLSFFSVTEMRLHRITLERLFHDWVTRLHHSCPAAHETEWLSRPEHNLEDTVRSCSKEFGK